MAVIMDGKALAAKVKEDAKRQVEALQNSGVQPTLAVILVGEDPASQVYVRNKERACKACGIRSQAIRLPASITQAQLLEQIDVLNQDASVHGILLQLPLPKGLDSAEAIMAISPEKDVDGFHPMNVGALVNDWEGFVPCTPLGCIHLLKTYGVELDGKEAVVIGRSKIVGKPVQALLMRENCTVTVCHTHTRRLAEVVRRAEIVVASVGKPRFVTADMIRDGAAVIDVGINRLEDGSLCGDVDFDAVKEKASFITPVPGGVGPMTVAMLMMNTVKAAARYGR
ncbi:MAG: bifunctional methylenetetrahydrofolate dehydrogenase/methenyltetrahydrofolate cyclohydrolase FolD [Clostridia bacterium]|nr:bifunctional methylenetetrahydrofolate dehydrogenase/methenyltetrahydrofolate cyclohydrolase FolD [Clostridia bacterium]